MNAPDQVKIYFKLERDEEGYPPVDWESLWATPVGGTLYVLDNTPFYVQAVSIGDTVSAICAGDRLEFSAIAKTGGHSTIRVIAFDEQIVPMLRESLKQIGCSSEVSNIATYFAVDIPPNVPYTRVIEAIEPHATSGIVDYEESSIQH
ncbi:DUF4265 domain-containing protein [Lysobacter enzymogenes]|uniref:DUF4265 domain-containing protein n=1 Tax=Lysobacter enzymogenes TaxID=69 RepID=UPI00384D2BC2